MQTSPRLPGAASAEFKAIRGAVQVASDRSDLVAEGVASMLDMLLVGNGLERADVISCVFTVTPDITSEIPALALRDAGWCDLPMLCASEAPFKAAPPRTIRVLAHVRWLDPAREPQHAYLPGTSADRIGTIALSPDGGHGEPPTPDHGRFLARHSAKAAVDMAALKRALQDIEASIGLKNVEHIAPSQTGPYSQRRNVSMYRSRRLHAVLRPGTVDAVQAIVRTFGQHAPGAGLHAISTGRNWGLGSAEPATDDVVTVDLSQLDAVRQLDSVAGWAIVEPGVTQLTLAQLLAGTRRMLNVTASSGHTSVVGNALERGVGLRRQRTEDLLGLEVVLPSGQVAQVGWWPDQRRKTAINPHGLGPSLLHLFTQSNLGIATAAVIHLLPRPEAQCVLRLTFRRTMLEPAIDAMQRWMAQGLVSGVLKVYDAESSSSYGGAPNEQLALLCVSGMSRQVQAISTLLLEEAEDCDCFTGMTLSTESPAADDDSVLQVVEHAYAGDPSKNEGMLRRATGADADQVDSQGGGWIFFLAFVPFQGHCVGHALSLIENIHRATGQRAGTTVNALSADVIDLVVSFRFSPDDAERAHRALDMAHEAFVDAGFNPYRVDIDHARWCQGLIHPSVSQLNRGIKHLLDPQSLIAPGRYA